MPIEHTDNTVQEEALKAVETTTENARLPELGRELVDTELLAGFEYNKPRLLEILVDETLERGLRSRRQTTKAQESNKPKPRTYYTLANMLIVAAKALTALIAILEELGIITLKTFKQSQTLLEAKQQLKAAYKEVRIQIRIGTYRNVLRNSVSKHRILRSRQVFIVKRGPDGKFLQFKARQVVRGYSQQHGVDYNETYAIVAKPVSLRVLFAILAEEDLEYYQYDLITTFLNVLVGTYTIYVEQLYGFETGNSTDVCLLLKALYSLKQAPLLQYDKFTKFARKHNFNLFLSDACVFRNAETGVIIVIYVNDVLIIAKYLQSITNVAKLIDSVFLIRLLGELHYYLGMRIIRNRQKRQLILVQDGYLDKIAIKFNLTEPFLPSIEAAPLSKTLAAQLYAALDKYYCTNNLKTEYQRLVGSGVQLVYILRPDCSYEIGLLCRFLRNPILLHLDAITYVLRYIVATKNRGIMF